MLGRSRRRRGSRSCHSFMHPMTPDVTCWLSDWADDLAAIDYERLVAIFNYLVRVSVTPVENVVRFAWIAGAEAREAAMTTADQLIAQGRAEGEARGEARGQARLLMRMLTSKFGELDPDVRPAWRTRLPKRSACGVIGWFKEPCPSRRLSARSNTRGAPR